MELKAICEHINAIEGGNASPEMKGHVLSAAIALAVAQCHGAAALSGWWGSDAIIKAGGTATKTMADPRDNPMCFSNKLMLTVSELAESMEGDRKNKMDDHLPQYPMRAVELADALIRVCDMAGAFDIPLGEIVVAKMAYNAQRADHKPAARAAEGGKTY